MPVHHGDMDLLNKISSTHYSSIKIYKEILTFQIDCGFC